MSDTHSNYLRDLGALLYERALDARRNATTAEAFQEGRAFAYYEVVALMLDQAAAFQIPPAELGLEGVLPDRDLLCRGIP